MAKGTNDVILRDRLQFTLGATGDLAVVYGRLDLSDYVNPVEKKGLSIKEFHVMPRIQNGTSGEIPGQMTNTGTWINGASLIPAASGDSFAALKVFGTTRAYQHAYDVGIGSPDVFHLEEWAQAENVLADAAIGAAATYTAFHNEYTPSDLHPDGYVLVSDILVGVAADNLRAYDSAVLELDILVIAQPVTIGAKQLTEMLTQAQDI
jgi:hypothetical protein